MHIHMTQNLLQSINFLMFHRSTSLTSCFSLFYVLIFFMFGGESHKKYINKLHCTSSEPSFFVILHQVTFLLNEYVDVVVLLHLLVNILQIFLDMIFFNDFNPQRNFAKFAKLSK